LDPSCGARTVTGWPDLVRGLRRRARPASARRLSGAWHLSAASLHPSCVDGCVGVWDGLHKLGGRRLGPALTAATHGSAPGRLREPVEWGLVPLGSGRWSPLAPGTGWGAPLPYCCCFRVAPVRPGLGRWFRVSAPSVPTRTAGAATVGVRPSWLAPPAMDGGLLAIVVVVWRLLLMAPVLVAPALSCQSH
jgi:hypothetical protein